jgi:O-antigen/teichoic acid export membrane protein
LLAISSVTDRFMIAHLIGPADAGKYVASLDLARQTLMLPAMSTAAAFFPLAIQIHARQGDAAVRVHFAECAELLFGFTLPAALGFAMISWHIANLVLGADFRGVAAQTMPIVAIAVVFQIMTQQYLHASFLLSGRNGFYLINTVAIIIANVLLTYVLVRSQGTVGAAWARLGADLVGLLCALALTRLAFPVPLPLRRLGLITIAGLVMALAVGTLDRMLHVSDLTACIVLAGVGAAAYAALGWLFDISHARRRLERALALLRARRAKLTTGPSQ